MRAEGLGAYQLCCSGVVGYSMWIDFHMRCAGAVSLWMMRKPPVINSAWAPKTNAAVWSEYRDTNFVAHV